MDEKGDREIDVAESVYGRGSNRRHDHQIYKCNEATGADSSSSSIDHQAPAAHLNSSVVVLQFCGVGRSLRKKLQHHWK